MESKILKTFKFFHSYLSTEEQLLLSFTCRTLFTNLQIDVQSSNNSTPSLVNLSPRNARAINDDLESLRPSVSHLSAYLPENIELTGLPPPPKYNPEVIVEPGSYRFRPVRKNTFKRPAFRCCWFCACCEAPYIRRLIIALIFAAVIVTSVIVGVVISSVTKCNSLDINSSQATTLNFTFDLTTYNNGTIFDFTLPATSDSLQIQNGKVFVTANNANSTTTQLYLRYASLQDVKLSGKVNDALISNYFWKIDMDYKIRSIPWFLATSPSCIKFDAKIILSSNANTYQNFLAILSNYAAIEFDSNLSNLHYNDSVLVKTSNANNYINYNGITSKTVIITSEDKISASNINSPDNAILNISSPFRPINVTNVLVPSSHVSISGSTLELNGANFDDLLVRTSSGVLIDNLTIGDTLDVKNTGYIDVGKTVPLRLQNYSRPVHVLLNNTLGKVTCNFDTSYNGNYSVVSLSNEAYVVGDGISDPKGTSVRSYTINGSKGYFTNSTISVATTFGIAKLTFT